MIKAYSQRLMPPYTGQVQIAESKTARALTLDGKSWEIQLLHAVNDGQGLKRHYLPVARIKDNAIREHADRSPQERGEQLDERIAELLDFLGQVCLPFPPVDCYEFWLLDKEDGLPLALICSCAAEHQMANFPSRPDWTALSAAAMPIELTEQERTRSCAPVNYQLERLVAKRAGNTPRASWFQRHEGDSESFPQLMLRDDWEQAEQQGLYRRYVQRQAPRLLMLHGLKHEVRAWLELAAIKHAMEVERYHRLYPEILDRGLINRARVEARLRSTIEE